MGLPIQISKKLAAAAANNISTVASPGAGAIVINGSTAAGGGAIVSGTITGGTLYTPGIYRNVPLTGGTGTGAVAGSIQISTAGAVSLISPIGGSLGTGYVATDSLSANAANLGGTGSGFAFVLGTVTPNVATLDTQRRVILTSGSNDTSIKFTVTGTNDAGNPVVDTFSGASGAAAQSNYDFKTVSSVTHTGSVAGTLTVGTNGVGSTPWVGLNWHAQPFNVELAGIVLAGATVNYTFEYTYDDPNNLPAGQNNPYTFTHPTLVGITASQDGPMNDPVTAVRLTVNSGTDLVRGTIIQAGISGQ